MKFKIFNFCKHDYIAMVHVGSDIQNTVFKCSKCSKKYVMSHKEVMKRSKWGNRMKKARYQVINGFQTLDDDGDWSNGYSEGDVMWRIIGTNKFEDEDGNLVIFRQKDIKDYLVKVG